MDLSVKSPVYSLCYTAWEPPPAAFSPLLWQALQEKPLSGAIHFLHWKERHQPIALPPIIQQRNKEVQPWSQSQLVCCPQQKWGSRLQSPRVAVLHQGHQGVLPIWAVPVLPCSPSPSITLSDRPQHLAIFIPTGIRNPTGAHLWIWKANLNKQGGNRTVLAAWHVLDLRLCADDTNFS